jgi:lipopolysaccharide export system permease protein
MSSRKNLVKTQPLSYILRNMKILERYIIKEHIGPFFFALAVIMFVLIMDFILKVVNLIIGRGLNAYIILQVFVLNLAWMIALAVPMAVLVATLMAFGRLSEDNEITTLKASGVSIYRIIAPALGLALLLMLGLIVFNNQVLPDANQKARLLQSAITQKRPTWSLREHVFMNEIPGYSILVDHIDPSSSKIKGVKIYDQKNRKLPRTIIAKRGELEFTPDGNTLILHLEDGEVHESDEDEPGRYRRMAFEKQTIYFTDVGSQLIRRDSEYRTDREMDSKMMLEEVKIIERNVKHREDKAREIASILVDSIFPPSPYVTYYPTGFASDTNRIINQLLAKNSQALTELNNERYRIIANRKEKNKYLVEIHKKYSIPVACVVFILIGAPWGIISRKGGIGAAAGLSLGFFVLYWAFLVAGEELADRLVISPFWAMWSANILIGILGIYILVSSRREAFFIPWEKLAKIIPQGWRKS